MLRTCLSKSVPACLAVMLLLPFGTPPAGAQSGAQSAVQQLSGQWQCQGGVRDPQGRKITVGWQYALALYPNGSFGAQGFQQGGVVRSQFQAQGRWQVRRTKDGASITLSGQRVIRSNYGPMTRENFHAGGKLYSIRSFGHNFRGTDGQIYALSCQKTG